MATREYIVIKNVYLIENGDNGIINIPNKQIHSICPDAQEVFGLLSWDYDPNDEILTVRLKANSHNFYGRLTWNNPIRPSNWPVNAREFTFVFTVVDKVSKPNDQPDWYVNG